MSANIMFLHWLQNINQGRFLLIQNEHESSECDNYYRFVIIE